MTRYSEPTNRQIEEACAMLFLAETKRLLHSEHLSGLTLELEVESNIHNQRVYRVHATRKGLRITDPEGRYVPPRHRHTCHHGPLYHHRRAGGRKAAVRGRSRHSIQPEVRSLTSIPSIGPHRSAV